MAEMRVEHLSSEPAVVDGIRIRDEPFRAVRVRVDDLDVVMSPESYAFMLDLTDAGLMEFLRDQVRHR